MLEINKLSAGIENKKILKDISLKVKKGEFHVIMGKNGTGKSTLGNILTGKENYIINNGEIKFKDENIIDLTPEERACRGMFMSFQYPVAIPGVNSMHFIRTALNSIRKHQNKDEIEPAEFIKKFKEKLKLMDLDNDLSKRGVNDGFSGGEKKRFEIIQMLMLNPDLVILDETDSGLDIDALKIVANGINNFRTKDKSFILITHYHRIVQYLSPDYVHIMLDGTIVKSGTEQLAIDLENKGYDWLKK